MQFIRKVYAILTVQLLFTTALSAVSFFSKPYRNWIQSNQWMMWVSLFGAIGFMLLTFWKRKSYVSTTPEQGDGDVMLMMDNSQQTSSSSPASRAWKPTASPSSQASTNPASSSKP